MGNFVLLKDSYDSITFDSYDLIPTLEKVYGKQRSCFYQVSKGKIEYQTHKIYSQWYGTHQVLTFLFHLKALSILKILNVCFDFLVMRKNDLIRKKA